MKKEVQKEEVVTFAAGASVAEASKKFGISPKTIYQWKGSKEGISLQTEGEYLVIRIPKKLALREVLDGMI
jgi:transposase